MTVKKTVKAKKTTAKKPARKTDRKVAKAKNFTIEYKKPTKAQKQEIYARAIASLAAAQKEGNGFYLFIIKKDGEFSENIVELTSIDLAGIVDSILTECPEACAGLTWRRPAA